MTYRKDSLRAYYKRLGSESGVSKRRELEKSLASRLVSKLKDPPKHHG
jgi:hypothetical protein